MPDQNLRGGIIQVINSPLGFFALSLLITEGFLSIVMVFSNIDQSSKFIGMLIGAGLFVMVVVGVFLLVCFRPQHLTFGEQSHLKVLEMEKAWGTSDTPETKKEVEAGITLQSPTT